MFVSVGIKYGVILRSAATKNLKGGAHYERKHSGYEEKNSCREAGI